MLNHDTGIGDKTTAGVEVGEGRLNQTPLIGRVHKNKVDTTGKYAQAIQVFQDIPPDNGGLIFNSDRFHIASYHAEAIFIRFNKDGILCPATQGFQTKRTGAGIQVQNNRSTNF